MSDNYLGEIRVASFTFAPKNWALCNGQLLPINQNQNLFALLGTMYGGNGQTNFALPNLQGRVPLHVGGTHGQGALGGEAAHTLTPAEMPAHTHTLTGSASAADVAAPGGNQPAVSSQRYGPPANLVTLDPSSVGLTGGSQAHINRQPYLVLSFIIALQGVFPPRN